MLNPGRKIDYLRISVTDRCNLRCMYCMPQDGIIHKPQEEILSFEEITRLVKIFASLGISKIRLTGGEVLVRKNVLDLINALTGIEEIEEVSLTTNGVLLCRYAGELKASGIKRINVSLDTLKEDRFKKITHGESIQSVFEGIDKARELDFYPLKLNMVVMKDVNDDEIIDFVKFSFSKGIILRFIEFMDITPLWRENHFMPIEEVIKICQGQFSLEYLGNLGPGPAVYYRAGQGGILGFIKTHKNNCRVCGRLRLTSTGELKNCLYETDGLLLRESLRDGSSDEEIKDIIERRTETKQYVDYKAFESSQFYMCSIGG